MVLLFLRLTVLLFLKRTSRPFASPPKSKWLSSNFEASCDLTRESTSTYNSFSESNHVLAALQIINDGISNDSVDKQSSGSKFSSFGSHFTLGRLVPTCDKAMSNLLGSKPVDGLMTFSGYLVKVGRIYFVIRHRYLLRQNIIFLPLVPFFRT